MLVRNIDRWVQMRRPLRNGALLLFLASFIVFFLQAGSYLSSPAQAPMRSDIILALGGDNGSRVVTAAHLYKQGYARRIMLTGLESGAAGTAPAYLDWRMQFLSEEKVPDDAVIKEYGAGNTWEEAEVTLALLKKNDWKRVIVVSDPPHMRRLHWAWSKVFKGSGKEFFLVQSDSEQQWWNPARWWENERSGSFVVMEYIKLAYYVIQY